MSLIRSRTPGTALSVVQYAVVALALAQAGGDFVKLARAADRAPHEDFFARHAVAHFHIALAEADVEALRRDSRRYVRAEVRVAEENFRDVGIHLKGTGSFRSIDDKPSLTLDFGKFDSNRELHGLPKVHLNNSVEDPSYLDELIGSELFRAAGVPTPRVAHAIVELNGRNLGLYVLKEGFTEGFLSQYFQRTDGNLYEPVDGHDVDQPMHLQLGADSSGQQLDLRALAAAAKETDLERRWERMHSCLDVDRFISMIALEAMIGHWDGYGMARNNFRVYHDPGTDRMVFLPTGLDQLFANPKMPWTPHMSGLVATSIMEIPEGREQYVVTFGKLFSELFHAEKLTNRVNEVLANLRPVLARSEFNGVRRGAESLCAQITEREAFLREKINQPEPKPLAFTHGYAAFAEWKMIDRPMTEEMSEVTGLDGRETLHIAAGPRTSASWSTTVRLGRGRYRFEGDARTLKVAPLPFGNHHGARLRIAETDRASEGLVGTTAGQRLRAEFDVREAESDVELLCELRASAGRAWFDKGSLRLVRVE